MEGPRFLLAIVLSIAVVLVVNLVYGPGMGTQPVRPDSTIVDTVQVQAPMPQPAEPEDTQDLFAPRAQEPAPGGAAGDTIWVRNDVVRYGISTRGGAVVSVELLEFESYTHEGPVQLAEPGQGPFLGYALSIGDRTASFGSTLFTPMLVPDDTIIVSGDAEQLILDGSLGGAPVRLTYTFSPDRYLVDVEGVVRGAGAADATLLVGLGPRLAINEADSAEDRRALAYVVNSRREGIESVRVEDVEADRIEEGPLTWMALKNKYFLAAALPGDDMATPFGGVIARAGDAGAESVQATLPLGRDGSFTLRLFFGPQEQGRLSTVAEGLEDVNPYGWRIFRPIIRPLAHLITWMLVGLHNALGLGYGWVLILFGFAMRGILWPLNAKAMRSQLKTMELQPRIKEIQARYKSNPEQLQKEMVKLYKEEGFNPLGGCLPMLVPWPVLITLFFVFQNTIEFRGVEFLWLPDLSRPDPLYILPVVLGASLFALQFMNMRAAPQQGPQQKMLMYFMPVMMVVIFLNFASGLNLYYAASNVASLPQQIQIIGERKRARRRMEEKKKE